MIRVANVQLHGYPVALLQFREVVTRSAGLAEARGREEEEEALLDTYGTLESRPRRNANYKCEKINFDKERSE